MGSPSKDFFVKYWGVFAVIFAVIAAIIVFVIIYETGREKYTPNRQQFPLNSSFWPQWYYRSPHYKGIEGTWPPNMFSKTRFWSPTFYTGSGLQYYLRPGVKDNNYPRFRWKNDNGRYDYVFGDIDQEHEAAMYTY